MNEYITVQNNSNLVRLYVETRGQGIPVLFVHDGVVDHHCFNKVSGKRQIMVISP